MIAAVAVGTGVGALARHLATQVDRRRREGRERTGRPVGPVPWATLVVNVVGSALLGWVLARSATGALSETATVALGAGLAGGLTTYSTFGVEIVAMTREGEGRPAAWYAAGTVALGCGAAALGMLLG